MANSPQNGEACALAPKTALVIVGPRCMCIPRVIQQHDRSTAIKAWGPDLSDGGRSPTPGVGSLAGPNPSFLQLPCACTSFRASTPPFRWQPPLIFICWVVAFHYTQIGTSSQGSAHHVPEVNFFHYFSFFLNYVLVQL